MRKGEVKNKISHLTINKEEDFMDSYSNHKCWEIMDCNNFNCPCRSANETECWQVVKRVDAYSYVSNTCKDCIVYMLKGGANTLVAKELRTIMNQKEFYKNK